jgi:hypothetical protein
MKKKRKNPVLAELSKKIPRERRILIEYAVRRAIKEYGKALDKLSRE